jgi:hypothetical protein
MGREGSLPLRRPRASVVSVQLATQRLDVSKRLAMSELRNNYILKVKLGVSTFSSFKVRPTRERESRESYANSLISY